MEKAVLVIDMPTKCDECRFHYETYDENDYYVDKCELLDDMTIDGYTEKYDGCPLKSVNQIVDRLEEKLSIARQSSYGNEISLGIASGLNLAIEIVKEELS